MTRSCRVLLRTSRIACGVILLSGIVSGSALAQQRVWTLEKIVVHRSAGVDQDNRWGPPLDAGEREVSTGERNFPLRWDYDRTENGQKLTDQLLGMLNIEIPQTLTEGSDATFGATVRGDFSHNSGMRRKSIILDGVAGNGRFDAETGPGSSSGSTQSRRKAIYQEWSAWVRQGSFGIRAVVESGRYRATVTVLLTYSTTDKPRLRASILCDRDPLVLPGPYPALGEQCWVLISGWRNDISTIVQVVSPEQVDSYGNHGGPTSNGIQLFNTSSVTGLTPDRLSGFKCPAGNLGEPCYPWSIKVFACVPPAVPDPGGYFGTNCYNRIANPGSFSVPLIVKQGDSEYRVELRGGVSRPDTTTRRPRPRTFTGRLISLQSRKCLDIAGGDSEVRNGARAHQWDCLDVKSQHWTFTMNADSSYQLKATHSGKCLDLSQQRIANQTPLHQWDCNDIPHQKWHIIRHAESSISLRSILANRCADVAGPSVNNGAAVQIYNCHFALNQRWELRLAPDEAAVTASQGRMVSMQSRKCLDISGGDGAVNNGARAHQWDCLDVKSQDWTLMRYADDTYQLKVTHSGKCLDLTRQLTANQTPLHQWDCHNIPSQKWRLTAFTDSSLGFRSVLANRCIDIAGLSSNNGAAVQLYDCHYQPNQRFRVSKVAIVDNAEPVPLKLFYSAARGDNFTTATADGERSALEAGYVFARVEGYVFPTQRPGTVPLKLFYNAQRGDNYTTATTVGENSATGSGYGFVRVEGYVYPVQQSGTVPLKNFWHGPREDSFSTSTGQGERDALSNGYALAWIEGYLLPAAGGEARNDSGLGGTWRYRLTCGTTASEGVFSLAPNASNVFGGKGDGPWDPGTVTLSGGTVQGNQVRGLKFISDSWIEPYVWNGQLTNDGGSERVDGEAQRSSGACQFFMDRNAGPSGFEFAGDWRYSTNCNPRTASGSMRFTRTANGKYTGRFNGPWEGVAGGDIWDGRAYGREVKFNFRPDGWSEAYYWTGEFKGGLVSGQVFWRGQPLCNFSIFK